MTEVVLPQRLQDSLTGDAMRDAGLDDDLGPEMRHGAPRGAAQVNMASAYQA